MSNYLYLDIETIPLQDPTRIATFVNGIKAPGQYKKPEAIEKWIEENKADQIAKTSFNGGLGHICQICCVVDGEGPIEKEPFKLSLGQDTNNEKSLLIRFSDYVTDAAIDYTPPIIVGHNVNGFDIPFIWQRCMVLGVKLPPFFPKDPKPWDLDTFDTMLQWAGHRGTVSLDNLAGYMGFYGKGDVDGSMVAQMWADGKHDEIAEYCMQDVLLTKKIHLKMKEAGL